jgi:hypothetical protein
MKGEWVCQAPTCEACRKRPATHGSLCEVCAETIDQDTEAVLERLHFDDLGWE